MNRDKVKLMREKLDAALVEFGKEFGVSVDTGKASFSDTSVTFKVEFAEVAANGVVMSRDAKTLQMLAASYGLPEDALGREFNHRGNRFKILGLNPRCTRFPVEVERADGKRFKYPEDVVATCLGMPAPTPVVVNNLFPLKPAATV